MLTLYEYSEVMMLSSKESPGANQDSLGSVSFDGQEARNSVYRSKEARDGLTKVYCGSNHLLCATRPLPSAVSHCGRHPSQDNLSNSIGRREREDIDGAYINGYHPVSHLKGATRVSLI